MKTIGSRIRSSREILNIQQSDLAKMVGVKNDVISNWERDVNKPNAEKMVALCKALNIKLSYLLDYYGESEVAITPSAQRIGRAYQKATPPVQRTVEVALEPYMDDDSPATIAKFEEREAEPPPTVEKIVYTYPAAAGIPLYADDDYERLEFPENEVPKGADFGIRIRGDSMEPTIEDGTIVWVRKTSEMRNGQIGVFMIDDEAICKRYYMRKDGICLESDNSAYEPIIVHDFERFGIIGRVLEYR